MNNAPPTGQVGLRDRPTDRPGYVRLAGTIPNSHAEHRLARRFSFAQLSRSPQISLCSLRATSPHGEDTTQGGKIRICRGRTVSPPVGLLAPVLRQSVACGNTHYASRYGAGRLRRPLKDTEKPSAIRPMVRRHRTGRIGRPLQESDGGRSSGRGFRRGHAEAGCHEGVVVP